MTNKPETPQPKPTAPGIANAQVSRTTRPAQLRKLLTRKSGATIIQIQKSFGWQPHTARAAISGLRKEGEVVDRSETGKGSVYRIASSDVAP